MTVSLSRLSLVIFLPYPGIFPTPFIKHSLIKMQSLMAVLDLVRFRIKWIKGLIFFLLFWHQPAYYSDWICKTVLPLRNFQIIVLQIFSPSIFVRARWDIRLKFPLALGYFGHLRLTLRSHFDIENSWWPNPTIIRLHRFYSERRGLSRGLSIGGSQNIRKTSADSVTYVIEEDASLMHFHLLHASNPYVGGGGGGRGDSILFL